MHIKFSHLVLCLFQYIYNQSATNDQELDETYTVVMITVLLFYIHILKTIVIA